MPFAALMLALISSQTTDAGPPPAPEAVCAPAYITRVAAASYRDGATFLLQASRGGDPQTLRCIEALAVKQEADAPWIERRGFRAARAAAAIRRNDPQNAVALLEPMVGPQHHTVSIPADAFQSVAATDNQFAAATALDSLTQSGSSLALYNTIAFQTSVAQARSAFEQLAGDSYASVKTGLIESAHLTTDAITARLRDDVNADGEAKSAVWVSGFGSWIDHNANGNAGNLKTSTGGVLAGADLDLGGVRLGLAAGYSQSDLKMKRRAATADSNNWHLGIYAGKKWNALGLRAGLTHTWHSIDLSRSQASAMTSTAISRRRRCRHLLN